MPVGSPRAPSLPYSLTLCIGGSSRNKLIVFADGTYLELFCWIDTPREFHAWAHKSPGLIDFALTSLPPSTAQSLHNDIMSRLRDQQRGDELHLSYTLPEAGSRSKVDGVQVKWEYSRSVSSKSVKRTDFPFFCHDVTSRSVRVPFDDSERTKQPCGAVGISAVEVLVPKSKLNKFAELYRLILGGSPRILDERSGYKRQDFEIGLPVQGFGSSNISLRSEEDVIDRDWLQTRGTGLRRLVLSVAGREGHGEEALGAEGIASTIILKW